MPRRSDSIFMEIYGMSRERAQRNILDETPHIEVTHLELRRQPATGLSDRGEVTFEYREVPRYRTSDEIIDYVIDVMQRCRHA